MKVPKYSEEFKKESWTQPSYDFLGEEQLQLGL